MCIKCLTHFFCSCFCFMYVLTNDWVMLTQSQLRLSFFWKSHRTLFLSLFKWRLWFFFFFFIACFDFTTFCTRTCVYKQHHTSLSFVNSKVFKHKTTTPSVHKLIFNSFSDLRKVKVNFIYLHGHERNRCSFVLSLPHFARNHEGSSDGLNGHHLRP